MAAVAQENGNGPAGDDLKVMRQMLEQQSKQLDVLAQEVARLNLLLEERTSGGSGMAQMPAEPETHAPSPESSAPKATSVIEAPAEKEASAEKAAPAGPTHIVAKGETLTAIAKHYKVTVPELLKVNKIADVRRLQIGQTVVLPPDAKMPASSPSPSPQQ